MGGSWRCLVKVRVILYTVSGTNSSTKWRCVSFS
jgi:hypothetical protein